MKSQERHCEYLANILLQVTVYLFFNRNVSKQAAEFVDGIETNIAAAEENQTAAEGKIKETEAVIAEVHDIKADVRLLLVAFLLIVLLPVNLTG
jgi:hypothetical protein